MKVNIQVQLDHLRTLPPVTEAEQAGKTVLAGWYYDFRTGMIEALNPETGGFASVV